MRLCLLAFLLGSSTAASSQTRTTPQPPKFENNHIERTDLAVEVPAPVDRYKYRIDGKYGGIDYHSAEVPLWNLSSGRYQTGSIPVGAEINLQFIQSVGGRNFFGFHRDPKDGNGVIREVVWVDGRFVKIAGQN
jgi:hypothetical protein